MLSSKYKYLLQAFVVALPLSLGTTLCGTEVGNPVNVAENTVIDGQAAKGPIIDATVVLYSLNDDGSAGEVIATAMTNESGEFSFEGDFDRNGRYLLRSFDGNYTDEADGDSISMGEDESLEIMIEGLEENNEVALTVLSTVAAERARTVLASLSDINEDKLTNELKKANRDVARLFGLQKLRQKPAHPLEDEQSPDSESTRYMLIQAAVSQYAADLGVERSVDLMKALVKDFGDGDFDGLDAGASIDISGITLPPGQVKKGLKDAFANYINNPNNVSGVTPASTANLQAGIPLFSGL